MYRSDSASFVMGQAHVRIARPTRDMAAAERYWTQGLGLSVLYRSEPVAGPEHPLIMLGWHNAAWHLELVYDPAVAQPPSEEDLLVLYLGQQVPAALVDRLEKQGGKRVRARNPYWDQWGVTILDPDGYRLVLSTRDWSNA